MKKLLDFIRGVRAEWFKIVWPSRQDVIRATITILIFSGLAVLFLFAVDYFLGWGVSKIFG